MIKFFHTADIHFGVENYGKIDPETGIHTRLLDFRDSFAAVITKALEEKIDFFLFSGDAYKTAHPTPTQQKLLIEQFCRLYEAGIPAVIIVGNHDHPLSFGKAHALDVFANLPVDGFHVISKPKTLNLETKSGPVQIVGIPWPARHNLVAKDEHRMKDASEITQYLAQRVSQIITHCAQELDPTLPSVLAGHLTVSTGIFSGSEKTAVFGTDPILLPSQLAIQPFDYVALGHLHRHQNLNLNGYPPVVYAGSTERVDFGERKEPKGFCRVSIEVSDAASQKERREVREQETFCASQQHTGADRKQVIKTCSYEFEALDVRPMIQVDVNLQPGSDQTQQILDELAQKNLEGALVKIRYHVPEGKKDTVDLLAVQRACSKAMYVAGIIPVHVPIVRERRASLKIDMKLTQLLGSYFDTKNIDEKEKKILMRKAEVLQESLQSDEE